jgi:mono/diheme cytochrome c family protein
MLAAAVLATFIVPTALMVETSAAGAPTFTKDVAPILYERCATCHRPGEIAPMTLMTYEDARPWAKAIKAKVVSREMPPWGADHENTLKMRNDRSLSEAQIQTIAAWVDAGAPRGNPADLPPAPKFAEGWTYGREPDYIIEMPTEVEIPAEGELSVLNFYSKVPFDTDRFAQVVEMRPGNRAVVHHASIYFTDLPEGATLDNDGRMILPEGRRNAGRSGEFGLPGSSKLLSFVPGRGVDVHRENIGKRIPAGKYINWQLHYNPTGKIERDRTRLGIWFNKVPVTHEVLIRQAGDPLATTKNGLSLYRAEGQEVEYTSEEVSQQRNRRTPNIPPGVENWSLTGITPVTEDITLYAMSPHMHLRGKSLKWVITYPDGREQTILNVPKFDFNWQFNYELAEPLKIPAGSKITGVGFYDNSPKNKWNPAPHLPVYWSEQSWDEMYQPFTEYSVDSQDLTKIVPVNSQQQP